MKTASFVPTVGYLVCPHCHEQIMSSNGREQTIRRDEVASRWENLSMQNWTCNGCHCTFRLPANPFRKGE